ncbi:MAG TPA: DUF4185 domain-containing protein [Phycisphaerae bacterium]|nr:DUF4185 domain-containing protein [Phycisphaerae bacterium]
MRIRVLWVACLLSVGGMLRPVTAQVTAIEGVEFVARLTGPGSINDTPRVGIGGTDLGHMVVHQDVTYFLFGDTFAGELAGEGGFWRWNTMAWSTDRTPADGIHFDGWITDHAGKARQVIRSGYGNPITEIPTGAVSIGERIYAWFMAVSWWGPPGEWNIHYAGLAYTQDLGQTFTVVDGFRLPANTNFGMVAASLRTDLPPGTDDHVYVWGTPSGRLGGVKLARVLPANITDPGAYEYYSGLNNGQPVWAKHESAALIIVPAPVGEMSVMYNRAAGRWIMLYFNTYAGGGWGAIELRQAVAPWGPWSLPMTVVPGIHAPGLYGSYMNPLYVEDHGQTLYFTMSLWDPYDVYLMRLRLSVASPPCPADLNVDGRVQAADVAIFDSCLSGDSIPYRDVLTCAAADLDRDGDVDQADFGILQRCLNGLLAPDPACAD